MQSRQVAATAVYASDLAPGLFVTKDWTSWTSLYAGCILRTSHMSRPMHTTRSTSSNPLSDSQHCRTYCSTTAIAPPQPTIIPSIRVVSSPNRDERSATRSYVKPPTAPTISAMTSADIARMASGEKGRMARVQTANNVVRTTRATSAERGARAWDLFHHASTAYSTKPMANMASRT